MVDRPLASFLELTPANVRLISLLVKMEVPAGFSATAERSPPKELKAPLIALNRDVPLSPSIE